MNQDRSVVRFGIFLAVAVITGLIANLLYQRWRSAHDSREWVAHTYEVRNNIDDVAKRVRDLQLGQRGYIITGDSDFLAPYWLAVGKGNVPSAESTTLLEHVRALERLTPNNARQQANLDRLHDLVVAKLAFVDSSIRLRDRAGAQAALEGVDWRRGKRLMDSIRVTLDGMTREEDSLLVTRSRDEAEELRVNAFLLYGTVALFYLLGLLAFWLASKSYGQRRRAEARLRESNALMDAVINGTDYAIFAADNDGILRLFNKGGERMLGFQAEDMVGRPVADVTRAVIPAEELAARAERIRAQYGRQPQGIEVLNLPLDDDGPSGQEWTNIRADGARISVALSVWMLNDADGNPQGSVAIARDITQLKTLERDLQMSSARLQAVIDGIDYAIFAADDKGVLRLINRGTEKILGYSVAGMVGRPVTEMAAIFASPEELRARASRLSKHYGRHVNAMELISLPLPDDGPFGQEWTHTRPDGSRITLAFSVYSLQDREGNPSGIVALARDITQLKALERMKNEFISTVSHELRTPLTSIRGALGLVAGGATGPLPDKAAELVSIAHRNSERLVHIINDILDIEKIESGKLTMHPQAVEAGEFLRQAVEANAPYGEKYGVRFVLREVPDQAVVMADPDRLMQVMSNLMSNAAKFSSSDSEVWLGAYTDGYKLRISVRDFGSGIPLEFQDRIFEKFAQAEGVNTRRHDGTGLGLSITRKLVELMGGKIGFTTAPGKGTEFTFTLPLAAAREAAEAAPVPGGPRASILVCEDDRDVSMLLKLLLERAGFDVDTALSLAEARERLAARAYAAMTLDLMLPDGNGVDFLRELRTNPRWMALPVVVVSAKAEEGRRELNGDAIGMIDWMTKPIDEGLLVRALRNVSSGSGAAKPRILHIEDDADLRNILARSLTERVEWVGASSLQEAEDLLRRERFDLVVLDLDLPDGSGLELLERLNALTGTPLPVLILSASETGERTRARVEAALVKSRMSEERIVQTILSVIRKNSDFSVETP